MKARDLTAKHIGQRFKLTTPNGTISGGLSDYQHLTTPKKVMLATLAWLNGQQLKLQPDTALTFTTKETK